MTLQKFDRQLKAIANPHRLMVLGWLKEPTRHFRPQVDGDLIEDGVCALLIGEKLGLAQPTTAQHLKILVDARLLVSRKIGKWTFYRRDEAQILDLKSSVGAQV